jgi:hypothetical protein
MNQGSYPLITYCRLSKEPRPPLTPNSLANIEFSFIGDAIDKLYATYFYQGLTNNELIQYDKKIFEDILAEKLADKFTSVLIKENFPDNTVNTDIRMIDVMSLGNNQNFIPEFLSDLDQLEKTQPEDVQKKKTKEQIQQISQKYSLNVLWHGRKKWVSQSGNSILCSLGKGGNGRPRPFNRS